MAVVEYQIVVLLKLTIVFLMAILVSMVAGYMASFLSTIALL